MNWKHDLKVGDLAPDAVLEVTCKSCGQTGVRAASHYQGLYGDLRIDELERRLRCPDRWCDGYVRVSQEHQQAVEGFVGGLP